MRILLPVLAAFSWVASVRALQESEAGVVDWHKSFIGVPRTNNFGSSPVFHRVHSFDSSRSVVLTTTENTNVLAALDPADGSIGSSPHLHAIGP
jgi:ER membrane protein complex subunit 1